MRAISRRSASGKRGILFRDERERALLRFVEQIGELDGLAAARFERLAVVAEDRAEPDMRERTFAASSGCQRRKMAKSCRKWSCCRPSVT